MPTKPHWETFWRATRETLREPLGRLAWCRPDPPGVRSRCGSAGACRRSPRRSSCSSRCWARPPRDGRPAAAPTVSAARHRRRARPGSPATVHDDRAGREPPRRSRAHPSPSRSRRPGVGRLVTSGHDGRHGPGRPRRRHAPLGVSHLARDVRRRRRHPADATSRHRDRVRRCATPAPLMLTGTDAASSTSTARPRRSRWTASDDQPGRGARASSTASSAPAPGRRTGRCRTERRGHGQPARSRPRVDSALVRCRRRRLRGGYGDTSSSRCASTTCPQGVPGRLPARKHRVRRTPHRRRGRPRPGAAVTVTRIPASLWRSMVGPHLARRLPVGRVRAAAGAGQLLGLRRLPLPRRDGAAQRRSPTARAAALRDMYDGQFPIRRMYREDRFGWSARLHGANDYASMRADNTSGFNCRSVVNRPGCSHRTPAAGRRPEHLGEPLPLGDRTGARLVVGRPQRPPDRVALARRTRWYGSGARTASAGPTATSTASTSTAGAALAGSFIG